MRDTLPEESDGTGGWGIVIQVDSATGERSELSLRRGLVAGNRDVGVLVAGSTAAVRETVVRDTLPQESDGTFGDGLAACRSGDLCWDVETDLRVRHAVVSGNARVGLFFYGATGSLAGSVLRGNRFAVALERGAGPAISEDNLFAGNTREGVTVGKGLQPAPPIEPLDLSDFDLPEPIEP